MEAVTYLCTVSEVSDVLDGVMLLGGTVLNAALQTVQFIVEHKVDHAGHSV